MDYKYCVIEYDVYEDGSFERTKLFCTLKEAIEWANDCYDCPADVYKLERDVRPPVIIFLKGVLL